MMKNHSRGLAITMALQTTNDVMTTNVISEQSIITRSCDPKGRCVSGARDGGCSSGWRWGGGERGMRGAECEAAEWDPGEPIGGVEVARVCGGAGLTGNPKVSGSTRVVTRGVTKALTAEVVSMSHLHGSQ